jgi:hypothetical protein
MIPIPHCLPLRKNTYSVLWVDMNLDTPSECQCPQTANCLQNCSVYIINVMCSPTSYSTLIFESERYNMKMSLNIGEYALTQHIVPYTDKWRLKYLDHIMGERTVLYEGLPKIN